MQVRISEATLVGFEFQVGDIGILISVALMILGARLLGVARRNRSAPELLIGLYLMLSPPATSLSMRIARFDPVHREGLQLLASLGLAVSAVCLAAFAWRVFRPNVLWARAATALSAIYFLASILAGATGIVSIDAQSRSFVTRIVLLAIYLWLFVECDLHRRLLERRLRLGLADPVVSNRFLLFEVWSGVLALLPGFMLFVFALVIPSASEAAGSAFAAIVRITGFAIYGAMWLSFLPPRAYTRWIDRRHRERHPLAAATA